MGDDAMREYDDDDDDDDSGWVNNLIQINGW